MGRLSFKLVPKMNGNICGIFIVAGNGETKQIAELMFPADGQLNDNVECAAAVCDALRKRIRSSV